MWQVRTKDFRVRKGSIFYILLPEGGGEKHDFQKKTGREIQTFNVKLGSVSDTWSFDVFFVF